jgi:hypothetical protein
MNMTAYLRLLALLSTVWLSACAGEPTFSHTWKDPDATPLALKGEKVAAVVLVKGEASRRVAEDKLAQKIVAEGAQGIAMYTLLPGTTEGNEAAARAVFEAKGVQAVVVMRPVSVDKELTATQNYQSPYYANYWGGYYGYGYGRPYGGYGYGMPYSSGSSQTIIREETIVYVETLVYSLKQNKLVWGAQSKVTDPHKLEALINELGNAAIRELKKEGLIKR